MFLADPHQEPDYQDLFHPHVQVSDPFKHPSVLKSYGGERFGFSLSDEGETPGRSRGVSRQQTHPVFQVRCSFQDQLLQTFVNVVHSSNLQSACLQDFHSQFLCPSLPLELYLHFQISGSSETKPNLQDKPDKCCTPRVCIVT